MMNIETFLNTLNNIADELETLNKKASDLYLHYTPSDDDKLKNKEALGIDELIETATHETATTIRFLALEIQTLANFLTFRGSYTELTDYELKEIIDNDEVSASVKLQFVNKLSPGNSNEGFEKIKTIRTKWNNTFSNKSYKQISEFLKRSE